ncbi:hypothetical protein PInf_018473 [Phytophthora infestans]|nr:hypothetical protein PInf_018473 [Phytophthora infestans]
MYELFLSELGGLYAQIDGVFHQNGMETSVDDSLRKAYVRTRQGAADQDELYAELLDVNILPFHFERAASAMCVLKRIPPDSGLDLSGCVMRNCVHIVPKRVDYSTSVPQDDIGLLTYLVIDSYEDDVIALSTMVEDLLLQEAVVPSKMN